MMSLYPKKRTFDAVFPMSAKGILTAIRSLRGLLSEWPMSALGQKQTLTFRCGCCPLYLQS
jgi:hypothetical protein